MSGGCTLILAESSLETVPEEVAGHRSVVSDARRRGLRPGEILLDRSVHHSAILGLKDGGRRGRPDIVYHVLLDVASTPLFRAGLVDLYVHTLDDAVISAARGLRPPRSYARYERLMGQLFVKGEVGEGLLKVMPFGLKGLVGRLGADRVVGFSREGRRSELEEVVKGVADKKSVFVVGGFPRGGFSKYVLDLMDGLFSISDAGLDASTVVNRLMYDIERAAGLGRDSGGSG